MRGLMWQTLQIPLMVGLNQKADPRALQAPALLIANDVQFDETGGLQARLPYASISTSIHPSGTLANIRRIYANGPELVCFTKDKLYSWNAKLSKWVERATHLAAKVSEASTFVTTGDQIDADRAELLGTVIYTWQDGSGLWAAALDSETEQVLVSPTLIHASGTRARLVALASTIQLFYVEGGNSLKVKGLDPASPATGIASAATTVTGIDNVNPYYDVAAAGTVAVAVANQLLGTGYIVAKVTAALAVTTSTKARTATAVVAIAPDPSNTNALIVRQDEGATWDVRADAVAISTLADVWTEKVLYSVAISGVYGWPPSAITAAWQDASTAVVLWSFTGANVTTWQTRQNTITSAGVPGTSTEITRYVQLASRAFTYDARVFVWVAFASASSFSGVSSTGVRSQLQNTYFLLRDDGMIVGKAAVGKAGGYPTRGFLPHVQGLTATEFAFAGVERRVIDLGDTEATDMARVSRGYGARAPRKITVAFDSNEARRVARLGNTLYITGGELLQYDGVGTYEVGFHIYPWYFGAIETGVGSIEDGVYAYKATLEWNNAKGEVDRSTTATAGTVTINGGSGVDIPSGSPLWQTHKTAAAVAIQIWRTAKNPTADAPFYLATSKDPASTGANKYLSNASVATSWGTWSDALSDATLTTQEADPEAGGLLEYLAPPAASIILASSSRLFLAGVSDDPHRVWYSRLRRDGEVASFHDALTVDIPKEGGAITGLAFLNETLIVFKASSVYALAGDGFDNAGGGQNYGPARMLSTDIGAVTHEAIGMTPHGLLFKSAKGWYLLNRGWALDYVGAPIADNDSNDVYAVYLMENQHQVRCVIQNMMLVWDYLANQWAKWTETGTHACLWDGTHHYVTDSAIKKQGTSYSGMTYGIDVETAWIKLADLQGFGRVRWFELLGEWRSTCRVRIRIARDYARTSEYFYDEIWTPDNAVLGAPLQFRIGPSIQRMQAIKIRITAIQTGSTSPPTGEAFKLTGLALEIGLQRGINRALSSAQKA